MTVIIFIIVLAVLILVHEFGHFIIAKKSGIRVDEFGLGFPPRVFGWKPKGGETMYSVNWLPFGGFVKIFGENPDDESISGPDSKRSFVNKPKKIQAIVLVGGILFNLIFAWLLFSIGFVYGMPYGTEGKYEDRISDRGITITSILSNSPAEVAGLELGDKILGLNGNSGLTISTIQENIASSEGNELTLNLERAGKNVEVLVSPEEGIVGDIYAVGIVMSDIGTLKLPIHLAIWEGIVFTGKLTIDITVGFANYIYDAVSGTASLAGIAGPVGIAGLIGDASALGLIHLLSFTAFISINLAVLNLIPFPALDGGRLLFVLIEKIKGSPIKPVVANVLNAIGFFLLVGLLFVVTYNDIIRLF